LAAAAAQLTALPGLADQAVAVRAAWWKCKTLQSPLAPRGVSVSELAARRTQTASAVQQAILALSLPPAAAVRQQAASVTESEAAAAARQAILAAFSADHCRRCWDRTAALETPQAAARIPAQVVAAVLAALAATLAVLEATPGLAALAERQRSRARRLHMLAAAVAGSTPLRLGMVRAGRVAVGTAAQTPLRAQMARRILAAVLAGLALRQVSPLAVRAAPALSSCDLTHRYPPAFPLASRHRRQALPATLSSQSRQAQER
jgi:hypothetical protein